MTPDHPDETGADFAFFSNEYAQALQAYKAIEQQSETLVVLGVTDELKGFIEQFIEMATRTRQLALDKNEPNFAEWFGELIEKAEGLRGAIARP